MKTVSTRYMTATELAARLGIHPETLRHRRRREGKRHARHTVFGTSVMYEAESAERYLVEWTDQRRRLAAA